MKSQYADLYATYVAAKGSEIMTAENSVASLSYTERTVNTDAAKLQTAIETKRQLYSTHYTAQNTAVLNKYFSDEDILFVSSYTPMAIVSVTAKELKALTSDSSVTHISLFENQELTLPIAIDTDSENRSATYIEEHWNKNSRADYVRDTLGLTGAGVKIGQVELGLPNVTDDLLTGATIITNSAFGGESWESHTYHATKVARIMVGTHGIVPDATLYSACAGESDQFYSAINWLISQGVNVINMSTCLAGTDVYGNQYDEFCNYVDALSLLYDVHFVASAGNYSDGQSAGLAPTYTLWRPALAYNAITVGAYNDNGTVPTNDTEILAKQGDDYLESYSKYNELDIADDAEDEVNVLNPYGAYKPNLVATGNYFWNESIANGTSYAAPQVTGVIAQLCSYNSTLKTKQSSMGAILMASCGRKLAAEVQSGTEIISSGSFKGGDFIASVSMNQSDNQISNKQGAGKLDAYWAYTIVRDDIYWSLTLNSSITSYTKDVYITKSTNTLTRVAIFWLMKKLLQKVVLDIFIILYRKAGTGIFVFLIQMDRKLMHL